MENTLKNKEACFSRSTYFRIIFVVHPLKHFLDENHSFQKEMIFLSIFLAEVIKKNMELKEIYLIRIICYAPASVKFTNNRE